MNTNEELCEALSEILHLIDKWRTDGAMEHWQYSQLFDVADNALALPRRNCDVGTAEEQNERFNNFCGSHMRCDSCPHWETNGDCGIKWAQMPYEEAKE